ncbi:phage tailspike protein [Erwinia mallotivora]|uniref:phage tailspike protein n=1 Tax=Erwinia mallotivora TaxID=69222 RepID=UPI0035E87715
MAENAITISLPVERYTMPRQFSTIFNGKIYVGLPDTDPTAEDNRIAVYLEGEDSALTPIAQPVSINADWLSCC